MDKVNKTLKKLDEHLHQDNIFTQKLALIEEKTGVKRLHLALGSFVVIFLWLLIGYGGNLLATFIGFLYPAYASIKAIESTDKNDDTMWLVYWVVFASFSLMEFFTDIFLAWFPFYALFKCSFLVYCMLPTSFNGSLLIYHRFLKPFFYEHENQIDSVMGRATAYAEQIADTAKSTMEDAAVKVAKENLVSSLEVEDTNKED